MGAALATIEHINAMQEPSEKDLKLTAMLRPISLNTEKAMRFITNIRIERKKRETQPPPRPLPNAKSQPVQRIPHKRTLSSKKSIPELGLAKVEEE